MEIINDFSTSVRRALKEVDPEFDSYNGLIVCGTHSPSNWQDSVLALKRSRESGTPTLGICFGLQMMVVEYFRDVIGWEDAQSTEIQLTNRAVVARLPELRVGILPVGDRMESHWHNYTVNNEFLPLLKDTWDITKTDNVVEEMKLKNHPFYLGTQYHAEYQSSKFNPHPILVKFLEHARKRTVAV